MNIDIAKQVNLNNWWPVSDEEWEWLNTGKLPNHPKLKI